MNDYRVSQVSVSTASKARARTLAAVYRAILSWPCDPKQSAPAVADLGREETAGSVDLTSSTDPDPFQESTDRPVLEVHLYNRKRNTRQFGFLGARKLHLALQDYRDS